MPCVKWKFLFDSVSEAKVSQPAAAVATDNFTEATVQEVVKLGFARDQVMPSFCWPGNLWYNSLVMHSQVLFELRRSNGDKTQAIAALLAKSFTFQR